jgi:hypothetical protein
VPVSAASVLARAQAAATALMVDACTVRHLASSSTDPETGAATPTYTTVYTGPCKLQQRSAGASPTSVGQAEVLIGQLEVHLPLSATGVSSDDLVTVTASAHDADLVGRTFRIRGLSHKSFLSARRFAVIEVTS